MKAWITKYALTQGILEREVEDRGGGLVKDISSYIPSYYHKKDYCLDKESAIAKAEEMRQKEIISLKNKIEKLEKMKFE